MTLYALMLDSAFADPTTSEMYFGGLRKRMPPLTIIVVSGALSAPGTSSAGPTRVWEAPYIHDADATGSEIGWGKANADPNESEATRRAISELRRASGLTWEQLGQLFEVSRRSVHFWASGKRLNAGNEERLMRVLDVVRDTDRGDARSNRAALFEAIDGTTPFDLLVSQRFDEARALLGRGVGRPSPELAELSEEAKDARKPLRPEELIDAKQDRVHSDRGHARSARALRNKRRGST